MSYRGKYISFRLSMQALSQLALFSPFAFASFLCPFPGPSKLHIKLRNPMFSLAYPSLSLRACFLFEQALDLLVSVSYVHYCTSTSDLSPCSLQGVLLLSDGISLLEVGFTLRCLQRLSFPDLATLPCIWYATDTPAVCPFRSSRTKNSSSQISYAHDG